MGTAVGKLLSVFQADPEPGTVAPHTETFTVLTPEQKKHLCYNADIVVNVRFAEGDIGWRQSPPDCMYYRYGSETFWIDTHFHTPCVLETEVPFTSLEYVADGTHLKKTTDYRLMAMSPLSDQWTVVYDPSSSGSEVQQQNHETKL